MSLQEKVNRYASRNCGQISKVDPPIFDPVSNQYIAYINARYPVYIFDDRSPHEYKVRILNLDRIGKIVFNEKEEIVLPLTTSSEKLGENLEEQLKIWRMKIENIVVSCSSDQLIKIEEFKHHLRPLADIFEMLVQHGKITEHDITFGSSLHEQQKTKRYLGLIEGLNLVRRNEKYYEAANDFIGIENLDNSLNVFLSRILKNRYSTLRDVFKLTIFEKTVGLENTIYMPELDVEEPVYRTEKSIAIQYAKNYGKKINPIKLTSILNMLERSGAIQYEDNHYFGVDKLRSNMIEEKEQLLTTQLTKYM